jgi:hypothetical protein
MKFAHANAISPLPNGDILISFRRLNMIALIDRQTRRIKWEHRDDSWGMQHDCEPLASGNITLFANGCNIATNPFSRVLKSTHRRARQCGNIAASRAIPFSVLTSAAHSGSSADVP